MRECWWICINLLLLDKELKVSDLLMSGNRMFCFLMLKMVVKIRWKYFTHFGPIFVKFYLVSSKPSGIHYSFLPIPLLLCFSIVVTSPDSGASLPGFKSWCCMALVVLCSWASYLSPLHFSFIYKIKNKRTYIMKYGED